MKIVKLLAIVVSLITGSITTYATVPLPDLVLYGQLFDVSSRRMTVANDSNVVVEVKINDATGSDDFIFANTTLEVSDVPNVGDIYILRIPREAGMARTAASTTVTGDILHITIDGIEVVETLNDGVSVTDDLEDVRNLPLHLSTTLPPTVTDFVVSDPSETTPGYTNERDVDIIIEATGSSNPVTDWLITLSNVQPAANDARWSSLLLDSFILPDADGSYELFAWVRDSADIVSNVNLNSSSGIILDRQAPTVEITLPLISTTVTNSNYSMEGIASDNVGLKSVEADANSQGFQLFATVSPWVYQITLGLGGNRVTFRSIDLAGNVSESILSEEITLESIPPGSLSVTIQPQGAIDAGARWKIIRSGFDSDFRISGVELTNIEAGEYTLRFETILGWITPDSKIISVVSNQTTDQSGTYVQITASTETFDLALEPGWNFISVPIDPVNDAVSEIFQGAAHIGDVWYWDGVEFDKVDVIEPGKAYWIYRAGARMTITIQGEDMSSDSALTLHDGWNAFGPVIGPDGDSMFTTSIPIPLNSQIITNADDIQDPIWWWDGGRFRVAQQLDPGGGYFILINTP